MKPPKNRDLVKGVLYHFLFEDGEEAVLIFDGIEPPWLSWEGFTKILFGMPLYIWTHKNGGVTFPSRLQLFEIVAFHDTHDLIWHSKPLHTKGPYTKDHMFTVARVMPKWEEVRAFRIMDVAELPLYLYMRMRYPAFDRLLKGGLNSCEKSVETYKCKVCGQLYIINNGKLKHFYE
jgi:hypothetical protein